MYSLPACNSQVVTTIDVTFQKIDSLIEIQRVNENCIIIKFGTDAITALKTKKGIVIIDAGISSGLTARYRKIIENEFQGNDFLFVINSKIHANYIIFNFQLLIRINSKLS